jgi:Concanavalin A-like lectin/glucanases superfamily
LPLTEKHTSSVEIDAAAAINDGNWHHIVIAAPATGVASIYVDGTQSGSLPNAQTLLATTTDRLLVGATSLATKTNSMHGSLDEAPTPCSERQLQTQQLY